MDPVVNANISDGELSRVLLDTVAYSHTTNITLKPDLYAYYPYVYNILRPNSNIVRHYILVNQQNSVDVNNIVSTYHDTFMECYNKFTLVQDNNYDIDYIRELESSLNELDNIYNENTFPLNWIYWTYRYNNESGAIGEMKKRIQKHKKRYFLQTRKVKAILGDFCDSLSPKIIHSILTWLKNNNPDKYSNVKRGAKEEIIHTLTSKLDTQINAKLCCEFIEQVNPVPFLKEFGIKLYQNGKRQKNSILREKLKQKFYNREINYIKNVYITPELRGLPDNVEQNIISYLA